MRALLLLRLALCAALAARAATAKRVTHKGMPILLVEEHHHVLPHLIRMARKGLLPRANATLLHLDSHADMGMPELLPDEHHAEAALPSSEAAVGAVVRSTAINNFLIQAAYLGLVEHIIFVEPPWSKHCGHLHNTTSLIAIGAHGTGTGTGDGTLRAAILRGHPDLSWFFGDGSMLQPSRVHQLQRVVHVRLTVIPLEHAARLLPRHVPRGTDLILDVDLDAFSTDSPGSIAIADMVPSRPDLASMYALAHDLCDMDVHYMEALAAGRGPLPCTKAWQGQGAAAGVALAPHPAQGMLELAREILRQSPVAPSDALELAIARRLQTHSGTITAEIERLGRRRVARMFASWLGQPYYVGDVDSIMHLVSMWVPIFKSMPRPIVSTMVRSPFYTPTSVLPAAECAVATVLTGVLGLYGGSVLHGPDVELNRVGCEKHYPLKRLQLPRFEGVENQSFPHTTRDVQELFFQDENAESDESADGEKQTDAVAVTFRNGFTHDVQLFYGGELFAALSAGESHGVDTWHGHAFEVRSGERTLATWKADRAQGQRQEHHIRDEARR